MHHRRHRDELTESVELDVPLARQPAEQGVRLRLRELQLSEEPQLLHRFIERDADDR